jgi:hypothetical protein
VLPVGIDLRDPRSQKRDLGHPSVSPFDMQRAYASSFPSVSLGITKRRVGVSSGHARLGTPFDFLPFSMLDPCITYKPAGGSLL